MKEIYCESITIPAHKRTVFAYANIYSKYRLQIPDMKFDMCVNNVGGIDYNSYYYYPYINGIRYISPFPNTYQDGKICLNLNQRSSYSLDFLLNRIYTSPWTISAGNFTWKIYRGSGPIYDVVDEFTSHFENWQKYGIQLIRRDWSL